jgi:hypothetical protein
MAQLGTINSQTVIPVGVHKNQTVSRDGTITTNQDWFDTSPSFALGAGKKYQIYGWIRMSGEGASTHVLRVHFSASGGLTFNSTVWYTQGAKIAVNSAAQATVTCQRTTILANINATQNNTTNGAIVYLEGIFDVNAGGDLTPLFAFSAAPGNASFDADTFMEVKEI